jgi:hypothetical protein
VQKSRPRYRFTKTCLALGLWGIYATFNPANAENSSKLPAITITGVARSVSWFRAMRNVCGPIKLLDEKRARDYELAFAGSGEDVYGKEQFSQVLEREMKRREAINKKVDPINWCSSQKIALEEFGIKDVFYPVNSSKGSLRHQ